MGVYKDYIAFDVLWSNINRFIYIHYRQVLYYITGIVLVMAVAAQQTRVAVGEDHAVRVDRKIVIDPRTGRAAEVENVTVAVDMGDGNIAVAQQQRITGYQTEGARYGAVSE